jgi:3-dehydroquinate synthetase
MIVTNTTVAPLYLAKVKALLSSFTVAEVILPDGEAYKTLDTLKLHVHGVPQPPLKGHCMFSVP